MKLRLYLAMHEVGTKQLADDDPPKVYETPGGSWTPATTATRSCDMLARQIHATLTDEQP
jgi:hypothetical protein